MKTSLAFLVLILATSTVSFSQQFESPDQFFYQKNKHRKFKSEDQNSLPPSFSQGGQAQKPGSGDSDLVRAVRDRREVFFLQASQLKVSKILPDDSNGLQHQRWYVVLSDGSVVFAVYNIDMGLPRVPVQNDQIMSMGGEFKWTSNGALMHWLHFDPQHRRPDGYVEVNGQRYGIPKN